MARGINKIMIGNLWRFPERAATANTVNRIMNKVAIDKKTGCWIWEGASQSNGYGRLWDGEKTTYAHRVSYEAFNGKIPSGMDIDHVCRNRLCVNPVHLEAVTRSENLKRGDAGENIAQPQRDKTHCIHGHEFTKENTRYYRGRRHCRACARERHHINKGKANG